MTAHVSRSTRRPSHLCLVWWPYQARAEGLAFALGAEVQYQPRASTGLANKAISYLRMGYRSLRRLLQLRPDVVWVQLPPTPALACALIYKLFNRHTIVIADCHNGLFLPPWVNTPFLRWAVRRYVNIVVVHNTSIFDKAIQIGLPRYKTYVLEDRPTIPVVAPAPIRMFPTPYLVYAGGGGRDEPFAILLNAAVLAPGVTLVVTGGSSAAIAGVSKSLLPDNVHFTNWLSEQDYHRLVHGSSGLIGLTTWDDVQLSVASEGVGFAKPLILSDTHLLRALFPRGALFVNNDAASLASAMKLCMTQTRRLSADMLTLREERFARWAVQIRIIEDCIVNRLG